MTDRPDATELAAAVAEWLATDLAPQLDRDRRFAAMVAASGLAIAARELALGEAHAAADREALGDLGALAEQIASGAEDARLAALAPLLREHVRRKLAIARPGYDAS